MQTSHDEFSQDLEVEQDTERILDAFRSRRALAPLPARAKAWERVEEAITGGFSQEKAKLVYATWRLVKLALKGAVVSGDRTLYDARIEEFNQRLEDFLA